MEADNKTGNFLKAWLEKLQEESWQLELLISGFAILGLFELRGSLVIEMALSQANLHSSEPVLIVSNSMLIGFFLMTHVFIINLLVHVSVRGLWIGAIGLRYVSGEIDYDKLKYSDAFLKYYKRSVGSFDDYIMRLEKFASVVFSYTFLLVFIFFSVFIFMAEMLFLDLFFDNLVEKGVLQKSSILIKTVGIFFLALASLAAFDFLTLGLIKRIKQKHISKIYLFLYKFIGYTTFSFLWRPLLLNFLDQKYTKRLLLFILPYILLIIFILPSSKIFEFKYFPTIKINNSSYNHVTDRAINKHSFNSIFYDSKRTALKDIEDNYYNIKILSIPSYRVSGGMFEVFIKYNFFTENYVSTVDSTLFNLEEVGYANDFLSRKSYSSIPAKEQKKIISKHIENFEATTNTKKETNRKAYKKLLSAIRDSLNRDFQEKDAIIYEKNLLAIKQQIQNGIILLIDGKVIPKDSVNYDFYIHPNAEEKGMLCFFPIDLKKGRHYLGYKKIYFRNRGNGVIDTAFYEIPFIYTGQ